MKKALLYIIGMAAAMTSCVSYEGEDFTEVIPCPERRDTVLA